MTLNESCNDSCFKSLYEAWIRRSKTNYAGLQKKTGKSLNRLVLDMINKAAGPEKNPPAKSLRKLAGGWTENEASDFNDSIKICEQIDEAVWR